MRIQYFSDVHLEFGDFEVPETSADVVIAAGDIGVGADGIEWLERLDKPVIYVAGNHEFYSGEFDQVNAELTERCQGTQIYFLNDDSAVVDGVRFIGSTLWADFQGGNNELMRAARDNMNDYHQIKLRDKMLRPTHTLEFNALARVWLTAALSKPFHGPTVVVTHHAPSYKSWKSEESVLKHAYCNDLSDLTAEHDIDLWVHGHIHYSADYQFNGVRVVCNPRGYHGFQQVDGFSATKTITI